ncbi:TonB-dependent receptor family protein [Idiomarina baltica]|uniref:Outer membrane protein n=1 Tax=Idiomarina baltica OS145 TaxID=314276 RepID=A0ABM9WKR0_9GAMM|nr:TonB-dependent receptor [Idiomarina baltica]EAQ31516.1 Outer membrane protein [Idiomarina baltica OS145]
MKYLRTITGLALAPALCFSQEINEIIEVNAQQSGSEWRMTPGSVDLIDINQQLPSLNIDAGDTLRAIPGIQADTRYNYAQDTRLVVRGFGARAAFGVRGLQLNVDGVPLSMPDGQAQTSSIILDEAETVEVFRGPLAVLYGNTGGGVFEWNTRAPQRTTSEIAVAAGANDLTRAKGQFDWVNDAHKLRFIATDLYTAGPRPHNTAKRQQQGLRYYFDINDQQQLILRYDNNNAPLLEDPSALTPSAWRQNPDQTVSRAIDFNTRKSIHHRQGSLTWKLDADGYRARIAAWQGDRDVVQFLPFAGDAIGSSGAVIDLSRQFEGSSAYVEWQATAQTDIGFGLRYERQQDHRFGFVNDEGEKGDLRRSEFNYVRKQAVYTRLTHRFNEQWRITAGARHSRFDFSVDDQFIMPGDPDDSGQNELSDNSGAVGLTWAFAPRWSTYISLGSGFETPTLTELAYRNNGSGLNTELSPSQYRQTEWGLKFNSAGRFSSQLAMFDIQSEDDIVIDQSNDGRTTYRNAGETERQGIEWQLNVQLTEQLDSFVSYSYIDANYQGGLYNGNQLPGVADSQWFTRLTWHPTQATQVQLLGQYRGETYADDSNTVKAPSYVKWDLAITQQWQIAENEFEAWLRVDNLLDRNYVGAVVVNQGSGRSFEPGIGRSASIGISWHHLF